MAILDSFMRQFGLSGYNDSDIIAICEYAGDIVAVECDDEMSGIYPHYKTARPIAFNWTVPFRIKHETDDDISIDAIIIQVDHIDKVVEINFATDSWDGFQLL